MEIRGAQHLAEEEDEVEDTGTTATATRTGAICLMRTAGRASLARVPGGISLVRTVLRATLAFLRCRHRQEGMMITTKMMELGASSSLWPSLAS